LEIILRDFLIDILHGLLLLALLLNSSTWARICAGLRPISSSNTECRNGRAQVRMLVAGGGGKSRATHIGPKTSVKDRRVLRPKIALLPFDHAV
jgi:hypothetical protein